MKPNFFLLIITVCLTALIGYSVFSYSVDTRKVLSTIVFSTTFLIYCGILIGFTVEYSKGQILKNTMSILFLLYSLCVSLFLIKSEYTVPLYLLINFVPLLIYGAIINYFVKAKY